MNLKVLTIIILLSICFFFGFKKISYYRNETKPSDIRELEILKYLPKNNKLLFISNFKSSNFIKNINKDSNTENEKNFVLIKDSILSFLGIDLDKGKLEEIYDNELSISTYENNKAIKDDILIVFKIKPEKDLDYILNLSKKINQSDQIIPIYRENKLNYLNYIYRTKDDYIITSSQKKLILDSIASSNNLSRPQSNYSNEISSNFKNQNNILFTKKSGNSIFFDNELFPENNEDIIATIFSLKDKDLILKSYLLNDKKKLDISSYKALTSKDIIDENNYQVSIYSDIKSIIKYLKPLINNFEENFIGELNQITNHNCLLLKSGKDWIIAFENNNQNKLNLNNIEQLKNFNKYTLEKNDHIYSIYSKDILEEKEDVIKKFTYEDIYTIDSNRLFIVSNNLIEVKDLDLVSKKFFNLKNNSSENDFLYKIIDIKGTNSYNTKFILDLEELNFLFRNIINIPNENIIEIVKQSIPEKHPILYAENSLKIFQ
tara:strand:- start:582 stop:2048 length:1467 start_codon:yes stop_codon:yes gene_type:complete